MKKKSTWLLDYVKFVMESFNIPTPLITSIAKLSFRRADSVVIQDETKIPEAFMVTKTTVTPDKVAIKKAIKEGQIVPGAELVESKHLQVK